MTDFILAIMGFIFCRSRKKTMRMPGALCSSYYVCINNYPTTEWLKTTTKFILCINLSSAQDWGGTKVRSWNHLKADVSNVWSWLSTETSLEPWAGKIIYGLSICPGISQIMGYGFSPWSERKKKYLYGPFGLSLGNHTAWSLSAHSIHWNSSNAHPYSGKGEIDSTTWWEVTRY